MMNGEWQEQRYENNSLVGEIVSRLNKRNNSPAMWKGAAGRQVHVSQGRRSLSPPIGNERDTLQDCRVLLVII